MIFVLVYFRALERKLVIWESGCTLKFSRFLVQFRQRNHRKYFCCHRKYFAKETFMHSLGLDEILLQEQNGQSRAGSIAPSCPVGQPMTTQNSLHITTRVSKGSLRVLSVSNTLFLNLLVSRRIMLMLVAMKSSLKSCEENNHEIYPVT